ncbi:FAR1-related protein [Sesbania bispinosa]|nr:FAR1-related protein [Sesbania bispinosa]
MLGEMKTHVLTLPYMIAACLLVGLLPLPVTVPDHRPTTRPRLCVEKRGNESCPKFLCFIPSCQNMNVASIPIAEGVEKWVDNIHSNVVQHGQERVMTIYHTWQWSLNPR